MTTETVHTDQIGEHAVEGERGLMVAMLVMVILGVAGIFVAT